MIEQANRKTHVGFLLLQNTSLPESGFMMTPKIFYTTEFIKSFLPIILDKLSAAS
jgi:hypothetical protein